MSVVPGDVDAERGPPTTIPLAHFVVGLGFLVAGGAVGVLSATGAVSGLPSLAHVHLLVAGWVCVTILGAMVQFVPVWSNVALYSRRLATAALWLVAAGVAGMAWSFAAGALPWVHAFGGLALLGFWAFAYNVARTLLRARPWDVTEQHFAVALAHFVVVPALGFALAMGYTAPVFADLPVTRFRVVATHATLAVFGAVLTTVVGALYQLATMFTQTEIRGVDRHLQRVEAVGYPTGVVVLAVGRLVAAPELARAGAVLVVVGLAAVGAILARKLLETNVERTPMLARYAVVAATLVAWAALAARAWVADPVALARGDAWVGDPLAVAALFGPADAAHLLLVGVVGFVVLGTLYHVVPFLVWVDRYSDRLGHEPVPMIDDLYDARLARADFAATVGGGAGLVAADLFDLGATVTAGAGAFLTLGFALAASNLLLVVRQHSPHSVRGLLVSRLRTADAAARSDDDESREASGEGPDPRTDATQ